MIAQITGIVTASLSSSVVLTAQGIGYEVQTPNPLQFEHEQKLTLFIHYHWNAENGPSLYGFLTQEEKIVFQQIITCQGIGPRLALGIIEHLGAPAFIQALTQEKISTLSSISGIGKKKAEHMIIQLKDKIAKLLDQGIIQAAETNVDTVYIAEVLSSLKYSRNEINAAIDYLRTENTHLSFDASLRKALSFLAKRA